jgi:intein-encoded DNA endonuclease-like protein
MNWIKACFQQKMKRIHNPPCTYEEFIDELKRRFKDLKAVLETDHRHKIQLSYVDSEGDLIEVDDTNDLL